jgi:hypothetical protein
VLYDVTHRDGGGRSIAIRVDGSGEAHDIEPPPARSPTAHALVASAP